MAIEHTVQKQENSVTVGQYLRDNGLTISQVRVISITWKTSVIDHQRPEYGCLSEKVVTVRDNIIYVL